MDPLFPARTVIIGAGRVATFLACMMHRHGFRIEAIVARNPSKAAPLAAKVETITVSFDDIPGNADLYILSVHDDAYQEVAGRLRLEGGLLVHTSGITPLNVLAAVTDRNGVFYPLQTFSTGQFPEANGLPVCIEAARTDDLELLTALAGSLSFSPYSINSIQRQTIHLAATVASNFSNLMYVVANEILIKNGLSFDILLPLIRQTAAKVALMDPLEAQTGAAARNDVQTMEKHLAMLNDTPGVAALYKEISGLITQRVRKNI